MARISLLFFLAFVLALGSLSFSVSGHALPLSPRKQPCPKTVSELQTLPFTQITEILNRKARSAPKTAEFKAMFTMCKGYVAYLESLYKFENPIVDVLGIAKTRYALMTKAILAAQASVSGKVNKKTSLKLKKSYADFTKGFFQIKETIVDISAKHEFKAEAKITAQESKKLNKAMINFKNSINTFMNVVCDLEKSKTKKLGHYARALKEEEHDGRVSSVFKSFFKQFGDYLGGKSTHGRELTEAEYKTNSYVGADVKGFESIYEKVSNFFNGFLGGDQTHRRELFDIPADAPAMSKEELAIIDDYLGRIKNSNGKGPYNSVDRLDGVAEGSSLADFIKLGLTGQGQYDAAGKAKAGGGDGFRSLSPAHYRGFIPSTEA
ncbi:hypothetical protein CARUB_v10007646mg [Capsella rubella]|uniref:DUF1216 domain-containing protein n=1 Tax=Capsella rubella TaxID=81985 RepID=R0GGF3_9BRAS|nr:uncharacterized protein LOC17880154 [Capsella rubella]EOA15854.1 hypothetical protein CARUB_v10007646mg [Capsella rubella]